jgi:iron complex outermembrane receptor protein
MPQVSILMRCAASSSLLALAAGAGIASAQEAPPAALPSPPQETNGAEAIGDIVVTAQKRSERINDVLLSISAATGAELANAGVTDTSQLVKVVPGFTYQLSTYGTPVYGLRGVSFYDTSGVTQPAVSVYVDQVPLPLSVLSRGASLDIERVEVLKGPQGTLFGENATGGAVNYIAAKPTDHFAAGADALYGRFNQAELGGYVSGPIGSTLSARLSARTEQRGDWQYSTSRRDGAGKRDFTAARLLLEWEPDDVARFELNINGWKDRSDTQASQFRRFAPAVAPGAIPPGYAPAYVALDAYTLDTGPAPDKARAADWDQGFDLRRDDSFFQVALRGEWSVTDQVSLTSLSSYMHYSGSTPVDVDGTSYADQRNLQTDKFDIMSQEVRASFDSGPLRLLLGGYYQYAKLNEDVYGDIESTGAFLAGNHNKLLHIINDQDIDTYAAFGGIDLELGHGLKLQGSARYTKQDRRYRGCAADGGDGSFARSFSRISSQLSGSPTVIAPGECFTIDTVTNKPAGVVSRSLNQDNVSWRAGLSWEPNARTLLYVNATKGYKAGGFATLAAAFTNQLNPVVQESVQAYEAGFKLTFAGGRLQFNGAAFHYDYADKQIQGYVLNPPFQNLPALINVPKAKIDGVELSLLWQPLRAFRLSASGTYVDARVSGDFITNDPFATPVNIKGETLPATPRWQGNVDGEYRFNFDGRLNPYVGAALSYQSRSNAAFGQSPEFLLPRRALVDLRAGIERDDGRWRIEAFGRNVTNRYYWVTVSHQIDTVTRLAGMPATYGVRATFKY